MDLGSGFKLVAVGINHYSSGRDPILDGPVGLQTERIACTGQQLISDHTISGVELERFVAKSVVWDQATSRKLDK